MISNRNINYDIMIIVGNEFGLWLQQKREAEGLSQAKLAKKAGLNRAIINKIENGYSEPGLKTLVKIADALNMPIEQLIRIFLNKKAPQDTIEIEELLYYLQQLSSEDRREIIELAKFKSERKIVNHKKSREKPPAQMLLNRE